MHALIMAPLRGFTDAVFRNAFKKHFWGVDEAIAPFVTSIRGRRIKPAHIRDLAPSENRLLRVVPQILSNNADEFICLANTLMDMGYNEINWNLGCPYPMVAKKMRGSGLLPYPEIIDRMLDSIFQGTSCRLSIKTRLGRFSATEIDRLIPVINRYPLDRVIIHPRTGVQMYTGQVSLESFGRCLDKISHPVVYNGDILDATMFRKLATRFPAASGCMLGRGLITNPFLPQLIQSGDRQISQRKQRFSSFHDDLLDGYHSRFSGPGHVLDRMKGFWRYFADGFIDGPVIFKKIRKTTTIDRYRVIVAAALDRQDRWLERACISDTN